MFQQGVLLKPTIMLQGDICQEEYAAISLCKHKQGFPLQVIKPPKPEADPIEVRNIKDYLHEIAKIVHGSLQSKEVLSKQIKQELLLSRKSIEKFWKDIVDRKKPDGGKKVMQLIDTAAVQKEPYCGNESLLSAMDEILKERVIASQPKVEAVEQKPSDATPENGQQMLQSESGQTICDEPQNAAGDPEILADADPMHSVDVPKQPEPAIDVEMV